VQSARRGERIVVRRVTEQIVHADLKLLVIGVLVVRYARHAPLRPPRVSAELYFPYSRVRLLSRDAVNERE
jgi:hypothetical protein